MEVEIKHRPSYVLGVIQLASNAVIDAVAQSI